MKAPPCYSGDAEPSCDLYLTSYFSVASYRLSVLSFYSVPTALPLQLTLMKTLFSFLTQYNPVHLPTHSSNPVLLAQMIHIYILFIAGSRSVSQFPYMLFALACANH